MNYFYRQILILALALSTAALSEAADAELRLAQVAPADMPGNWMGLHPGWRSNLIFYPDGTFIRPHVNGGRWIVRNDKGLSIVELHWNQWAVETLAAVSLDQFSGQQRTGMFRLYRVPPAPAKNLPQNPDIAEIEPTKALLNDSKWELIDRKRFMLHADGSISSEFDDRKGTWEVVAPNTIKISVPWQPAPPSIITTNRDATILRWTEDETNLAMREGT